MKVTLLVNATISGVFYEAGSLVEVSAEAYGELVRMKAVEALPEASQAVVGASKEGPAPAAKGLGSKLGINLRK